MLGTGVNDVGSTSFLKSFYKVYPLFPDEHIWECRLSLVCYAVTIGHPSYSKADLVPVFEELQASAVYIPASSFTLAACTLLQETLIKTADGHRPSIAVKDIWAATAILNDMALGGENVMTEEIVTSLQVAVIIASDAIGDDGYGRGSIAEERLHLWLDERRYPERSDKPPIAQEGGFGMELHRNAGERLKLLVDQYGFPERSTKSWCRLLNACADIGRWDSFWNVWSSIPRNLQHRDQELYAIMFRHVAQRNHQANTLAAHWMCIPLLRREEPPVELEGELARAVLQCLTVADPKVEDDIRTGRNERGEWVRLYRRCQDALRLDRTSP